MAAYTVINTRPTDRTSRDYHKFERAQFHRLSVGHHTPIDDVQVYDKFGFPASPYADSLATVRGVVYERQQFDAGSHYIQGETGGISIFLINSGATLGDEIEVSGIVSSYSGEIQFTNPTLTVLSSGNEVVPLPVA